MYEGSEHLNSSTVIGTGFEIISAFDLSEGMTIPCKIFYKHDNAYSVALKNSALTKLTLIKLQKLQMTYGNLYVESQDLDTINNIIDVFNKNKELAKFYSSFNTIQSKSQQLIQTCFDTQNLDKPAVDEISFSIKDTVVTVNASQIIQAINNSSDGEKYLYHHSVHVAFLNGLMGKWLKLSDSEISDLVYIGFVHDVGKTKIPSAILDKPGPLTDEEFEVIKTHPIHSFTMLLKAGEKNINTLLSVRGHHEKTNGTGYPDGLTYDKIPFFARITTISDIYDAMVSKRVYKAIHSPFEVLDEFSRGRFSNLDTHLINTFLENMPAELVGKRVMLSDGRIGQVVYVNTQDYMYPLIKVDGEVIATDNNLKCVSIVE